VANYYEEFSETIEALTPEEEAWIRKELEVDVDCMNEEEYERWAKERGVEEDYQWSSFDWEIKDGNQRLPGRYLWLHSSDGGVHDCLAIFVQRFLKKFRPEESFILTWGATVSRPISGNQFGGGAFLATAEGVKWFTVWDWVAEQKALRIMNATG